MSMGKTIRNNVILVEQNRKFWSKFEKGQTINVRINYNFKKKDEDKILPFRATIININDSMLSCKNIKTNRVESFTFAEYVQNSVEINNINCNCQDCKNCMNKLSKQLKQAEKITKGIMGRKARFNF